jgi:outer membrane protein, heavy metal efflux system
MRRIEASLALAVLVGASAVGVPRNSSAQTPTAAPARPAPVPAPAPQGGAPEAFTMERAVAIAMQRSRDVVAAKLEIEAAEVDRIAAGLYWNPNFFYNVGNVVVGAGNPQGDKQLDPSPFSQLIQQVGVSEVIDVWAKRSARIKAADLGVEQRRLRTMDAMREIAYAVRSAFSDVVREQQELELATTMKSHYDETVKLSRARVSAGESSEFEGQKIELEGMKYGNLVIDAQMQLDLARQALAQLMGLATIEDLPGGAVAPPAPRTPVAVEPLVARALEERPDLRAARKGKVFAEAMIASAEREAYPDIALGVTFTHSGFTVSGDNANALGLGLSLPLPLFDRNQAGIARSRLDGKRVLNDVARLELIVRHDVTGAARREERAHTLLDVYENGGLLARADNSLKTAEKSYRAGAVSLLELLEAQRTFIETRGQYLRVQDEHRKAKIDVVHAVGREP